MQVERDRVAMTQFSGARVRNAYATYLKLGDSPGKGEINTA